MAFRGAGGDFDREERRRLQEYEHLVDQDYDPFHEKCGKVVFLNDEKLIATNIKGVYGVVFSAEPIPLGGVFQVRLLGGFGGLRGPLVSADSNQSYTLCVASKVGEVIPNISIFY